MTSVTFRGAAAYLIDDAPHWAGAVEIRASLPGRADAGLTGREARRPLGNSLRLVQTFSSYLYSDGAITAWRNALQAIHTEPVLCPLWPAWFEAGDTPAVTTDFYVLMDDTASPEIKPDAERPFARDAYPLLVGRLEAPENPVLLTDEWAEVSVTFVEDDDTCAVTLPAFSTTAGPTGAPLFPWTPNWANAPASGAAEVPVERREIGQRRSQSAADYDARARRTVTLEIVPTPWNLLRLFLDLAGPAGPLWVPGSLSEARLTASVGASDTALTVDSPSARGDNDFLWIDDVTHRLVLEVTSTVGNDWNLASPPGYAFDAAGTRLESAFLGRFDGREITLRFETPEHCTAQLRFIEVAWEEAAVAGETSGVTIGELPLTAYLYQFEVRYPDGAKVWAYTGFESDLDYGGLTFTSAHIDHTEISEALGLESNGIELRCRHDATNPLATFLPFTLEFPLLLHVWQAEIGASVSARRVFRGEVASIQSEGPYLSATARILGSIFDRQIPRQLVQRSCNWTLFDVRCGLVMANWRWSGAVDDYDAATGQLLIDTLQWLGQGDEPTLDAHWLAGGMVQLGFGDTAHWRLIQDNYAAAGGQVIVVLGSALRTAPAADTEVQFWPGCDGQYSTCLDRFDNGPRFGGFPHIPLGHALSWTLKSKSGGSKK